MKNEETDKLDILQILRGIAVIWITLFYYNENIKWLVLHTIPLSGTSSWFIWDFTGAGYLGVDLFFLISGFVMVYTTKDKQANIKESGTFLIHRLTRILPCFYVAVLVFVILYPLITFLTHSINHLNLKEILYAVSLRFVNTRVINADLLIVRWTLRYELYFYLVFTFAILFPYKRRVTVIFAWCLLMSVILPLVFKQPITYAFSGEEAMDASLFVYISDPIIWEFFLGAVVAKYYNKIITCPAYIARLLLVAWAFVFIWYIFFRDSFLSLPLISTPSGKEIFNPSHGHSLWTAFLFLWLLVALLANKKSVLKYTPKFLLYIGNISYSIYLYHFLVFEFTEHVKFIYATSLIIAFLLTWGLAHVSHKYIEVKLSHAIREKVTNYWERLCGAFSKKRLQARIVDG